MALIVEDGTCKADAQSYASVSAATAYHAAHGNAAWALAAPTAQEAALVRATAALDGIYADKWPGYRCTMDQALDWPRYEAWDRDDWPLADVPPRIVAATCEAALVELITPGALSEALERGGQLIRKKTGPLEKEWAPGASPYTVYPAIRHPLSRIIRGGVRFSRG